MKKEKKIELKGALKVLGIIVLLGMVCVGSAMGYATISADDFHWSVGDVVFNSTGLFINSTNVVDINSGQTATFIVAASDSLHPERADYVCDGDNDQVEIKAAMDAMGTRRGIVQLLEGTYMFGATLNITDGVTLRGQQCGVHSLHGITRIEFADGASGHVIFMNAKNVWLQDLYINGNKNNCPEGRSGIYIAEGAFHPLLENICVADCGEHGYYMQPTRNRLGMYIKNAFAEWNNGYGFYLSGTHGYYEFLLQIHHVNGGVGIYLDGVERSVFVGAHASKSTGSNWKIVNSSYNTFLGCGANDALYTAIYLDNSSHNTFEGGWIYNPSRGINGTYHAVGVSNSTGNIFDGMQIWCDPGNTYKYAFKEYGTADRNQYRNNVIKNSTDGLHLVGSGSIAYEKYSELFMDVLAVSATHIRLNEDLSEAIPNTFTIDAQPDVPRTLSGHFDAHAQITAYTIVITGTDAKGNTVTETFTEAASQWDFETVNAYATITSINMTTRTGTGAGDTMDIGITDVLGLSNIIYETGDVFKIKKNSANAAVATAQVNTAYDTYDMSVIGLGAADDFTIWYRSNLNIIS